MDDAADGGAPPASSPAPPPPRSGAGPGRRSPRASRSDYRGCALWAGGFLVLVVVSFAVGVILRPDSDTTDGSEAVTLAGSVAGDSAYELVGRTDELGSPCVTLRKDGDEVTGQCGFAASGEDASRYIVTSSLLDDGTTVVFAPVPRLAEQVRLTLADGSTPTIDIRRSPSSGISWFTYETDQTIDGPAEILDGNDDPLVPG